MTGLRLSLSGGSYLNLDDDGLVIDWSRGTYGIVLKLEGISGAAALKLPNMSGHSDSELPLIPALLAQERLSVARLFARDPDNSHDLLGRCLASEADDRSLQEQLLVCFGNASEPPRVSCVALWTARRHPEPTILPTCGIRAPGPVDADDLAGRWYSGLPVMRYEWATGSLGSALDSGCVGDVGDGGVRRALSACPFWSDVAAPLVMPSWRPSCRPRDVQGFSLRSTIVFSV
jgi:hypothetical protein